MTRLGRVFGSLVCVLVCATPALSQAQESDRVDRALRGELRGGARTQKVIISVRRGYRPILRQTLEAHGDVIKAEHASIEAMAAEIHASDIDALSRQAWVESIALDASVYAIDGGNGQNIDGQKANDQKAGGKSGSDAADSPVINPHLRETLGLDAVATGTSAQGRGIVVAIVDSGIQTSADLDPARVVAFYDLTQPGCARRPQRCATLPFDDNGHGTHIAGLIGSAGVLSGGLYQGVAPRAKFAGFKVLAQNGSGQTSDVIAALEYISANRARLGVNVVNLSLGHDITMPAILDPLVRAVEHASAAGLVVVVAAGNNPRDSLNKYGGVTSPANAPSAVTVGAADTHGTTERSDDNVADYSGRGPTFFDGLAKPDVVAPGSRLVSNIALGGSPDLLYNYPTLSAGRVTLANGSTFMRLTGTSMSAAVASGVTALVLEANRSASDAGAPALSPNAVKAILQYTAIPIENVLTGFEPYTMAKGSPDVLTQGAGEINAKGAMALASHIDTTTSLGQRWLTGSVAPSSVIGGVDYLWARHIIWGSSVIGGDVVSKNLLLWSHYIIWGTDIVWSTDRGIVRTALGRDNILSGTVDGDE